MMNTHVTRAIDGGLLLRRLSELEAVGLTTVDRWIVNEARTEKPVAEAQKVLERAGYQLSEWDMVERDFYQLTYTPAWRIYPYMDRHPYRIKLRMITTSLFGPQLALVFYEDGLLRRYDGSYPSTYGTMTSDAEKMMFHFRHDHPGVEPKWLPIFEGHFPVVDRNS